MCLFSDVLCFFCKTLSFSLLSIVQTSVVDADETTVNDILSSKQWKLLGENGPKMLARCLMKGLFNKTELLSSSFGGKKGIEFDQIKIARIKGK